jgi:hypothetical protein
MMKEQFCRRCCWGYNGDQWKTSSIEETKNFANHFPIFCGNRLTVLNSHQLVLFGDDLCRHVCIVQLMIDRNF